ncbi:MAG: potassium transporter TrkH [Rhizobiales bacterium]|nr:potassium transporter TrkH [Hyphomicrobiales bacterium]
MIPLRPVLLINGLLLATLGSAMMLPAIVDLYHGDDDWLAFVAASGLTLFVGGALALANFGGTTELSTRQAFLLTTLAWVLITAFAALPFVWSRMQISYVNAFFEAMSGVTTTGATVIVGLDSAPKGILLWRALLQWLGGIGIIVMAIAVMPMLRVGGMQLFRLESSDNSGKILPRARQIAGAVLVLYLTISTACFLAYLQAGMSGFDAATHMMSTVATGGFSTRDNSIGAFDSVEVELVAVFFMIVASLPFLLLWQARSGNLAVLFRDVQVKFFFSLIAVFVLLAWLAQVAVPPANAQAIAIGAIEPVNGWQALRHALFSIVSVMTGTGYATAAYDTWNDFAATLFLAVMLVGGCAGSTSCGIKVFRVYVAAAMVRQRVMAYAQPHRVVVVRFNGKPLGNEVPRAVMNFLFLFLLMLASFSVALSLQGLDPLTALSSAATALANVGPGLGPVVGPAGNFASLPDISKWTLSFAMLLGRLELFTVIVLFTPAFWRG